MARLARMFRTTSRAIMPLTVSLLMRLPRTIGSRITTYMAMDCLMQRINQRGLAPAALLISGSTTIAIPTTRAAVYAVTMEAATTRITMVSTATALTEEIPEHNRA